ncbi:MAG: hypothetical protein IJT99_01245 [Clostridia bacterium]|nr:hypothetical protein [Clostridia bacterium]
MSKDHLYDREAICPFYRGTKEKQTILCEGPFDGSYLGLTIPEQQLFDCQRKNYCNGNYRCCEIYRMVTEKYKD